MCSFRVWAPRSRKVGLRIVAPEEREHLLDAGEAGYWQTTVDGVPPASRYWYVLEETIRRPDPASDFQPDGVHGPSEVVDHSAFQWTDAGWEGVPLEDMVIYELHVGTFTPQGTFEAIVPRLAELSDLGVTAVELMPVAQFPGKRNWGYDGAFPYAVQGSYGGPAGLKTLVNAIHRQGMSAILDVVYNHVGPEGNHLRDFGPYFTGKYKTPWGDAVNYDEAHSHHVRDFFIHNALHWLREYHLDALRLDALHAIYDQSAKHFIQELAERVAEFSRAAGHKHYLIGESDLNDVRLIRPVRSGGYGLDAQWSDDFHHGLHALLTGENAGYYQDFGSLRQLAQAFRDGFVYSWRYSRYRQRFHGSDSRPRPARQFVVCAQNHDQIGNRMLGERLSQLVDFESLKLAAATVLLSPYVPLLFMGEEYGEDCPFLYFVSHTDEELIAAVRAGRRNEFAAFRSEQQCPDPQAIETFWDSQLRWEKRAEGRHRTMLEFHQELLKLRRGIPHAVDKKNFAVKCLAGQNVLLWHRKHQQVRVHCLMNFSDKAQQVSLAISRQTWTKVLDSADRRWDGLGATLPDTIRAQREVIMPRRSMAVFQADVSIAPQEQAAARAMVAAGETIDAYPGGDV